MKYVFSRLALVAGAFLGTICLTSVFANSAFAQATDSEDYTVEEIAYIPVDDFVIGMPIMPAESSTTVAAGFHGGEHPGGGEGFGECHGVIGSLTDDQLTRLHAIHNQLMDEVGPKIAELASKHRKLKDVMLANNVDSSQAKALQSDINSIKAEIANARLDSHIAMSSVLTADQKKEIRDHIYRMPFERMAHRHHKRWHHHEGMQ